MTRQVLPSVGLALMALLPRPGQVYAQAQAQAHAVPPADLVGTWVGHQVGTTRTPGGTADWHSDWHLILRSNGTYLWRTHPAYRAGEKPQQHWQGLRGDTLALDDTTVFTVRRGGTREQPELQLTALTNSGPGPVFRLAREWTTMAVTGRPIKCTNGRIKTFACENVELLSYLPREAIGRSAGYDMWGWHDSATGREFLLSGGDVIAFIEVTDPVNPRYLGVLAPHDSAAAKFDADEQRNVRVYQHYALVAYDENTTNNGLQVFDLRQLRTVKKPTTFHETAHYDGFVNAHTLTLNPETGLVTANSGNTCGGGLHMVDVRTPTKPVFAGCYNEPRMKGDPPGAVHDAQCVLYRGPDRQYQGREICVNYAYSGVSIADVTDRKNPKTISMATYPNVGAAHQGWFTEDQRYVFVDDEIDEYAMWGRVGSIDSVRARTIGLDLTDLDDPVVLVEYYNPNDRTGDHNLFIHGRYMYQGNGGGGLRIIDIADPKVPKEVGYLAPKRNDADDEHSSVSGIWQGPRAFGTYPYFKNGVVALSLTTGVALARLLKP